MKQIHLLLCSVISCLLLLTTTSLEAANSIKWHTKTKQIFIGQSFPVSLIAVGNEVNDEPKLTASDIVSLQLVDTSITPMGSKNTFEYRYSCVIRKKGIHQLPITELTVDNKVISPASKAIEVHPVQQTNDMSIKTILSEQECYVGQPLFVKTIWESKYPLSIVRAVNLIVPAIQDKRLKTHDLTKVNAEGGITLSVPINNRRIIARCWNQSINGSTLYYLETTQMAVPQKAGEMILPPTQLICSVARHSSSILRSLKSSFNQYPDYFDNEFFEDETSIKDFNRYRIVSEPVKLTVKPVPHEDRPSLFNGLVDGFALNVEVSPTDAKVGTPLTIKMTVSNTQFPETVDLPKLIDVEGLDKLFMIPKKRSPGIVKNGKKVFTQTVRPLKVGIKAFPSLKIPFFNSVTGQFEYVQSQPIPLNLEKNEEFTQYDLDFTDGSVAKTEVTKNESGVMYNYTIDPNEKAGSTMYNKTLFIVILIFFILITGGIVGTSTIRRKLEENMTERRQRRALRRFTKQQCTTAIEVETAVRTYFADKLLLNASAVTIHDIEKHLASTPNASELLEPLQAFYTDFDKQTFSADDEPASKKKKSSLLPVISKIDKLLVTCALFGATLFSAFSTEAAPTSSDLISQADKHFEKALAIYETDITESQSEYTLSAMKYQKAANLIGNYTAQGKLLYNAGNAWYFANKPGQAIFCYLSAKKHLPYDSNLSDNLKFVRTQVTDAIEPPLTTEWVQAALFFHYFISIPAKFWLFMLSCIAVAVLVYLATYKKLNIDLRIITTLSVVIIVFGISLAVNFFSEADSHGVIVANDVMPYKGNSYSYEPAFATPLHAGTEFIALDQRDDWTLIQLMSKDECWLPNDSFKLIK